MRMNIICFHYRCSHVYQGKVQHWYLETTKTVTGFIMCFSYSYNFLKFNITIVFFLIKMKSV